MTSLHNVRVPRYVRQPFLISLLISFSSILGLLTVYFILQPQVPLYYSLARPEQFLVPKSRLFVFPGLSLLINALHLFSIKFLQHYEQVLVEIFAWITVAIQIFLVLALIRIIMLVI